MAGDVFPVNYHALRERRATAEIDGYGTRTSFANRAAEQLREWPALQVRRGGTRVTLREPGNPADLARLRRPDEAELRLTWPVIRRLGHAFTADSRIHIEPGSDWVRVRLHGTSDVRLLVTLVSLAIREQSR
jgi:hypothetical protein